MAIVKMKKLRLIAAKAQKDELLEKLEADYTVEEIYIE